MRPQSACVRALFVEFETIALAGPASAWTLFLCHGLDPLVTHARKKYDIRTRAATAGSG
jgi:hypothetical protein